MKVQKVMIHTRVDWWVIKHLSTQGKPDPRGASVVISDIQIKLERLLFAHLIH
jgi:hypothetical protein